MGNIMTNNCLKRFHPASMYYCPKKSMSELAWNNRYKEGVNTYEWPKINGGGYYKAVNEPPIGGRAAISSYPNCCPPVFCGELTGGKKRGKKISINHRIGHSIYEADNLLKHLNKTDLNKLVNKFLKNNKKYNLVNYNNYF